MPDPPAEDPLAALREHVRHAHAAAERLAFAAGGPGPPPGRGPAATDPEAPSSGWASEEGDPTLGRELRSLAALLESLNGLLPPELRQQLHEVVHQILLLIRDVVDWLAQRMAREAPVPPSEVQDIPIR